MTEPVVPCALEVVLLQGAAGSGKSTWAKDQPNALVVSADHFLIDPDGVYRHTPERQGEAHRRCLRSFIEALLSGTLAGSTLIVDTTLAVWFLQNSHLFDGTGSVPSINRLLELNDRLDVTGGAFPMALDDELLAQHNWIFRPYTEARVSGVLASMDAAAMTTLLEALQFRLTQFLLGKAGQVELRRNVSMYSDYGWLKLYNELDGNEARYALWSQGMDAFVACVATRADERSVYSIGRRSRYIDFPLVQLYEALTFAEPPVAGHPVVWGGSDIIGGSSRVHGSSLSLRNIHSVLLRHIPGLRPPKETT